MVNDSRFHEKHEKLTEEIYNTSNMLPSRYVFVITNLCNLRCKFCFQDKEPRKDVMNAEDWINLLNQCPPYSRITLTGGEPLLFPGFKKLFSSIAEKFNCNIITNGLLLNKEIIDYLLSFKKFSVLSLSIDNIGNTNRGVNKKQWENLEEMLKYFVNQKKLIHPECILDVKTMILDENAEDLFKIHKYLIEELKIDTHVFQLLKGSPIQHADKMYDFKDILEESNAYTYEKWEKIKGQFEKVKEYDNKIGRTSFIHPKVICPTSCNLQQIDYFNDKKHIKERFQKCKFPWSSVHINVDGELFPCLAVSMGNVKNKSLREIIMGKEMKNFRDLIKKEGTVEACNRCGWLRIKGLSENLLE